MSASKSARRLTAGIIVIILLLTGLCATTFALVQAILTVENNFFQTGYVSINLNNGEPIIREHEFIFEPGMTVKKDFFIQNESTLDVYYRLYFTNVQGDLADVLEISIMDGENLLFFGTAAELNRENVGAADDILHLHECRELTIYFHFPEEAGNSAQNQTLSFDMCAEAVQTKNNPDRLFD